MSQISVDGRVGSETEAKPQQTHGTMRYVIPRDRVGDRRTSGLGEQSIQDGHQIRCRICQSPVEVEKDAWTLQPASGRVANTR